MEHENKTRIPAWLRPSTIRRMDGWLEEANCKSRSEFIEKSLHFYMGYLGAEDASEYLPNALTATLRGIVADSTNRTNCLLFKCAVEQGTSRSASAWAKAADRLPGERIRITMSSGRQGRSVPSSPVTGYPSSKS